MQVICAPDKFKGSLTAVAAAAAMARGVRRALPGAVVDVCPIADGGEGTVDAMLAATGGLAKRTKVHGPLFEPVDAAWGVLGPGPRRPGSLGVVGIPGAGAVPGAVIEMAAASGLALVPRGKRNPLGTTAFGTGELVKAALGAGAARIILGIGGSATNDGGIGMAAALGVRFFDQSGAVIDGSALTGGGLEKIARIDAAGIDPRIAQTRITVACDVTNPLTGPRGAAAVYGPQKGATPEQVKMLDRGLVHLASLWREQLGVDVESLPGAGAAGGLGGGLVAFLGAKLARGVDLVLEAVEFDKRVAGCDLCLTGEGMFDGQSLSGKACIGVAAAARRGGVRTVALVGSVGPGAERSLEMGLAAFRVIGPGLPVEESIRRAAELLEAAASKEVSRE